MMLSTTLEAVILMVSFHFNLAVIVFQLLNSHQMSLYPWGCAQQLSRLVVNNRLTHV